MQIVLIILAFILLIAGLIGSVIPAVPGPPLCYIGLLLLQWSGYANFSFAFLMIWAVITVVVTVMDNFLPALMTKKFGGSRAAVAGSVLGLIVGMFFTPLGLLVGPFLGAFVGELINNHYKEKRAKLESAKADSTEISPEANTVQNSSSGNDKALKVALGAFLAFIVGTGAKLIIGSLMIYYAVKIVFFQN